MRLGLVLSGGGAKGAYQVGLFRALEELGLREQLAAVSGCSIGAINALLLAGADRASWEGAWSSMRYEDLMLREAAAPGVTEGGLTRKLGELVTHLRQQAGQIAGLPELMAQNELLPFSQDGMRAILRQSLDFARLENGPDVWLCAYNLQREEPEYFHVNALPTEDVIELAMASSAIPLIFPPVSYRGQSYCDGGIVPSYVRKKNADKIPVKPLEHAGCDLLVAVYLSHLDRVELGGVASSTRVLELYPSTPLEMIKGAGTLNLSREARTDNLLMGYHDGLAALAPILLEQAGGGSGAAALAAHAAYNRQLLSDKVPLLRRAEEVLKSTLDSLEGTLDNLERKDKAKKELV